LGHANWDDLPLTSFTNSKDAASIDDGLDNIRGSRDDVPSPLPGSRVLHWFRVSDNNPVVIDGTVIDSDLASSNWRSLASQCQPARQ
jgi:hypothetical protein